MIGDLCSVDTDGSPSWCAKNSLVWGKPLLWGKPVVWEKTLGVGKTLWCGKKTLAATSSKNSITKLTYSLHWMTLSL